MPLDPPEPLAAVWLFDLDGTLLDTEELAGLAITETIRTDPRGCGASCSWELKQKLLGKPGSVWPQIVVDELGLEMTAQELFRRWELNLERLYPTAAEMPGASELLALGRRLAVPMALCTSSTAHAVASKRRGREALFDHFEVVVCGDDPELARGKPSPDIWLLAARRLEALHGQPLDMAAATVFEDSLTGVVAGVAAGCRVVAIPDKRLDPKPFLEAGAAEVLGSLAEFSEALETLA